MTDTFTKTYIKSNIENDLIDPFIKMRTDICPCCKAQRIDLISFNGYPQNYKEAVNAYLNGYSISYDRYEIRSMRCKSCNREFIIDWTQGFPKPLIDSYKINRFFSEFSAGF